MGFQAVECKYLLNEITQVAGTRKNSNEHPGSI